ncbi:MAG: hypothetical protein HFI75_11270 [Lachnospiraceae bacterium]|nr:hypothetical protein [Lachnospiraceae bacterium]
MRHGFKKALAFVLTAALSAGTIAMGPVQTKVEAAGDKFEFSAEFIKNDLGLDRTEKAFDSSYLSVTGYAAADAYKVGDRSQYVGTAEYKKVYNTDEFLEALSLARSGKVKVIEVCADLDLGWNMISESSKSKYKTIIEEYSGAGYSASNLKGCSYTNPDLIKSSLSALSISNTNGLTIFSMEGYSISHAEIKIAATTKDLVVRNLRFDGMWEWDDWQASNPQNNKGQHKRTGWSTFKINGADNVWLDHCEFGIAFDGCVDISGTTEADGCEGVSITWCTFGKESLEPGSMLYNTMEYLEEIYQESKVEGSGVESFTIYGILRDSGLTPEECIIYGYLHSKGQLTGDGDKDFDKNPRTRYTLAYNQYYNMQQRIPMVRQGSVHLYNCLVDYNYMNRKDMIDKVRSTGAADKIGQAGGSTWNLHRAIDARNGASILADTCVYKSVNAPITGSVQNEPQYIAVTNKLAKVHQFGYNHALIFNSSIAKWNSATSSEDEPYVGSSWDKDGLNAFIENADNNPNCDYWKAAKIDENGNYVIGKNSDGSSYYVKETIDKSQVIGKWTWKELTPVVKTQEFAFNDAGAKAERAQIVSDNEASTYDQHINTKDDKMPYSYQTVALENVEETVKTYGGAGVIKMEAADWLKTSYDSSYQIQFNESEEVEAAGVTLDESETDLYMSEHLQLYATVTPAAAITTDKVTLDMSLKDDLKALYEDYFNKLRAAYGVTWSSSNEEVAKVGSAGLVTPLSTGDTVIKAELANGQTAECLVHVYYIPKTITLSGYPSSTILYVGDQYPLTANVAPKGASEEVTWESDNLDSAEITEDGLLTAIEEGNIVVTATAKQTGKMVWNQTPVFKSEELMVLSCANPVAGVSLDRNSAAISLDSETTSLTLTPTITAEDPSKKPTNSKLRWSSSDDSVVTVEDGVVNAVATGSAVVTVTTVNGGFTDTCEVTVTATAGEIPDVPDTSSGAITIPASGTAVITGNKSEVAKKVLTEEELAQIASGASATIYLEAEDISATVSDAVKELVETAAGDNTVGTYLNIDLYKQMEGASAEAVSATNGKIGVRLQIPESLLNTDLTKTRTYTLLQVSGEAVELPVSYDAKSKTLEFETDQFTAYALLYFDKEDGSSAVSPEAITIPTSGVAVISGDKVEVAKKVLTEEEMAQVASGDSASIYLEAEDISENVSEEVKALIEAAANGNTLGACMNITLFKQVGAASAEAVSVTNGKIKVVLQIPENMLNADPAKTRSYTVLQVSKEAVQVPATFDAVKGTLEFETDQFATFALMYTDEGASTGKPVIGNVNGDNFVNAKDAVQILRYAAKLSSTLDDMTEEERMLRGNVNGDKFVNAKDAVQILRYAAKLSSTLDDIYNNKAVEQAVKVFEILGQIKVSVE